MKYRLFLVALFLLVMRFPDKLAAMEVGSRDSVEERNPSQKGGKGGASDCDRNTKQSLTDAAKQENRGSRVSSSATTESGASQVGSGDATPILSSSRYSTDSRQTQVGYWSPSSSYFGGSTSMLSFEEIGEGRQSPEGLSRRSSQRGSPTEDPKALMEDSVGSEDSYEESPAKQELNPKRAAVNEKIETCLEQLRAWQEEWPSLAFTQNCISRVLDSLMQFKAQRGENNFSMKRGIYLWEIQRDECARYLDELGPSLEDLNRPVVVRSYAETAALTEPAMRYQQACRLHEIIARYSEMIEAAQELQKESTRSTQESLDEAPSYDSTIYLQRISASKRLTALRSDRRDPSERSTTEDTSLCSVQPKRRIQYGDEVAELVRSHARKKEKDLKVAIADRRAARDAMVWLERQGTPKDSQHYRQLKWWMESAEKHEAIVAREADLAKARDYMVDWHNMRLMDYKDQYGDNAYEAFAIKNTLKWAERCNSRLAEALSSYNKLKRDLNRVIQDAKVLLSRARLETLCLSEELAEARRKLSLKLNYLRKTFSVKNRDGYIQFTTSDLCSKLNEIKHLKQSIWLSKKKIEAMRAEQYLTHPRSWSSDTFENWQAKRPKTSSVFSSESSHDRAWKSLVYAYAEAERAQKHLLTQQEVINSEATSKLEKLREDIRCAPSRALRLAAPTFSRKNDPELERYLRVTNGPELERYFEWYECCEVIENPAGYFQKQQEGINSEARSELKKVLTAAERARLKAAAAAEKFAATTKKAMVQWRRERTEYIKFKLLPEMRVVFWPWIRRTQSEPVISSRDSSESAAISSQTAAAGASKPKGILKNSNRKVVQSKPDDLPIQTSFIEKLKSCFLPAFQDDPGDLPIPYRIPRPIKPWSDPEQYYPVMNKPKGIFTSLIEKIKSCLWPASQGDPDNLPIESRASRKVRFLDLSKREPIQHVDNDLPRESRQLSPAATGQEERRFKSAGSAVAAAVEEVAATGQELVVESKKRAASIKDQIDSYERLRRRRRAHSESEVVSKDLELNGAAATSPEKTQPPSGSSMEQQPVLNLTSPPTSPPTRPLARSSFVYRAQ